MVDTDGGIVKSKREKKYGRACLYIGQRKERKRPVVRVVGILRKETSQWVESLSTEAESTHTCDRFSTRVELIVSEKVLV